MTQADAPCPSLAEAMAAHNAGRTDEAAALYERLLEVEPDNPDALNLLAVIEKDAGRLERAASLARRAAAYLAHPYILGHLAEILSAKGETAEAEAALRQGLELAPENVQLLSQRLNVLAAQDRLAEAEVVNARLLTLQPQRADILNNLGAFAHARGAVDLAEVHYRAALAADPGHRDAHHNLSRVHLDRRELEACEAVCREALALAPDHPQSLRDLGDVLLFQERWAEAWPYYEHRLSQVTVSETFRPPRWQGEDLGGGTLIIVCEQGLGDSLQFVRYASWVRGRGAGRVVVAAEPALTRILALADGVDEVVALDALPMEASAWIPMMSLPLVHGLTLERVGELLPLGLPYLRLPASPGAGATPRAPDGPLRVGLFWAGGHHTLPRLISRTDDQRSLDLGQVLPLMLAPELDGRVAWTLLQRDRRPPYLDDLARRMGWRDPFAADAAAPPGDLLDTAWIIQDLDLVIGVDSALIHLSGALNTPTWMLDRATPCWRWGRDRPQSDWYPGALTIFRQTVSGDWDGVIRAVRAALRARVGADAGPPG
ncbi:MAG: tetratricopeptide repeat protein [Alphaproteobacteria bacterium]|nr:tetratricopeptide repeat protein [Alphaproteobacteria bacterium]